MDVSRFRQQGYGAITGLVLTALLSLAGTYYYQTHLVQSDSVKSGYDKAADEIRALNTALLNYYKENNSWPPTLNALITGGHFAGDPSRCGGGGALQSSFCTAIFGAASADNLSYTLSINTPQESIAASVANLVSQGTHSGSRVSTTINVPFQSAIYEEYLQRQTDPSRADRTQLETDIDVNNNDLLSVNEFNADIVAFDSFNAQKAIVKTLSVSKEVLLGKNSIETRNGEVSFNATDINVNGRLRLNGDVLANGHDISGVGDFSAASGSFDDLSATVGVVDDLSGQVLDYQSGKIKSLSGTSLNYTSGNIANLSGKVLDFDSGTIDSLSGNTLTFGVINGTNINGTNGNISNFTTNLLNATNANLGTLVVSGVSNLNQVNANRADITAGYFNTVNVNNVSAVNGQFSGVLSSKQFNAKQGSVDELSVDTINVAGSSVFQDFKSEQIEAIKGDGGKVSATTAKISGDVVGKNVSTANLTVTNALKTNSLEAEKSNIGRGEFSSFIVSKAANLQGINTVSAKVVSADIGVTNGKTANITTLKSDKFVGGNFNATSDFISSKSSVNNNYLLISEQKSLLDHCMDVTKYCIPEKPTVDLTCPTCNSSAARSSFSGIATASIKNCRQGCTYRWVTSGSGLNFSSCTSGSVAKGSSASPSCRVSTSLGAQESVTGNIQIIVTNAHYTSKISADTVGVSYLNTTANNPFLGMNFGCWVDTPRFDKVSRSGCNWLFFTNSAPGGGSIHFSVGDIVGRENYEFSTNGFSVVWTGGCSGTESSCRAGWSNNGSGVQNHSVTAIATVTHNASGQVAKYTVRALVTIEP